MRFLIIDGQIAGLSGDMFLSALLDLAYKEMAANQEAEKKIKHHLDSIKTAVLKGANLEDKVKIAIDIVRKRANIAEGYQLKFSIKESPRELDFSQALHIMQSSLKNLNLSDKAQFFCEFALKTIFDAEAKVHDKSIDKIHLHEMGSLDTFLDIIGVAYFLEHMNLLETQLCILPLATGFGTITFSHGTVSIPPPAVTEIIQKFHLPIIIGKIQSELLTPTGAALIASLCSITKYTENYQNNPLYLEEVGIGFGFKEFENVPNSFRLLVGKDIDKQPPHEEISIIETNLDDCTGEVIGFLTTRLIDLGAKDVYLTPIYMKKNRPGTKISVLCNPHEVAKFTSEIFTQTSAIGVRVIKSNKIMLQREIQQFKILIDKKEWLIRGKIAYDQNGQIVHYKPEFEDIKNVSEKTGHSIQEVLTLIREEMAIKLKK